MINLKDFSNVADNRPKGKFILSFPSRDNITLNSTSVHFFNDNGFQRVKLMISKDNNTVLAVASEEGCKIRPSTNCGFTSHFLSDLVYARSKGESVRFLGESEGNNMLVFDLTKPIYY